MITPQRGTLFALRVAGSTLLALLYLVTVAPAQTRFEGQGHVLAIDEAKGTVTLDHGPIPGLMPAMRMEFGVAAPEVLRGLRVGDVVRFTLEPRGSAWVVASAQPTAPPAARGASRPAPHFALPTLSDATLRLAELRGRVVLLNFWATWCVPCRTEMPAIERLHQRYRDRGLEVVGVNLDVLEPARVEGFVKSVGVTFRIALDPSMATARAYGVVGLPTTYLIDRVGQVVVREVGERDWADRSRTGSRQASSRPTRPRRSLCNTTTGGSSSRRDRRA